MIPTFSKENFHALCDHLGANDKHLKKVLEEYGYPPMWTRKNTFESLIHVILEQQVSLASALAALRKLQEKLANKITPERFLLLSDEELKACYFSRQKIVYARGLALAIKERQFKLKSLEQQPDDLVRQQVIALKGLGNWTADIYLMFMLRRMDVFPIGDLAARNSLMTLKNLPPDTPHDKLAKIAAKWSPYKTLATMILWHYYLSVRVKGYKG